MIPDHTPGDPIEVAEEFARFNGATDLLPPTHPNGPRKISPGIQVPVSDEMRRQARPPTRRGWSEPGWEAPWWPYPIGVDLATGTLLFDQQFVERFSNDRAVDRTFENEVRPR